MTRSSPIELASRVYPPDTLDSTGRVLCRYCRKPIPKGRRKTFCSDECNTALYRALDWERARQATWLRDRGKCRMCGEPVYLKRPEDDQYIRPEYKEYITQFHRGNRKAETHHVIHVGELWEKAQEAVSTPEWDNVSGRTKVMWAYKFYALLYLDVNNLVTLCLSPCHDEVHSEDRKKAINGFMKR